MTSSRIIEEERGTWTGHAHPHNGYYAGRFEVSTEPVGTPRSRVLAAAH
jgi:hypothetical protein